MYQLWWFEKSVGITDLSMWMMWVRRSSEVDDDMAIKTKRKRERSWE